ncbi:hypothetical protein Pelo_46 [Pelomyxa schiedti]|nr:hypothetical protein Pelo_46 [Pelomyxa schiedti]
MPCTFSSVVPLGLPFRLLSPVSCYSLQGYSSTFSPRSISHSFMVHLVTVYLKSTSDNPKGSGARYLNDEDDSFASHGFIKTKFMYQCLSITGKYSTAPAFISHNNPLN